MRNDEKKMLEALLAARTAESLGVPKSLIAGYLLTKYSNRDSERDAEQEEIDERNRREKFERERIAGEISLNDLERKSGRTRQFLQALEEYEYTFGPRRINGFDILMAPSPVPIRQPQQQSVSGVEPTKEKSKRKWLLFIGIFFVPYIFSWFTLKSGYSKRTRLVAFGWMVFLLLHLIAKDMTKH